MEPHKIEILLKKYLEGNSSLEEEKKLHTYFSSENVAPQFSEYRVLFGFFGEERKKTYPVPEESGRKKKTYAWAAIAASIAIILGVFLYGPNTNKNPGVINDPEIALQKTKDALDLIAQQMNNGREELVYLTKIEKTKEKLIGENLTLK